MMRVLPGVFLMLLSVSACDEKESGQEKAEAKKVEVVVPVAPKPAPLPFPVGAWVGQGSLAIAAAPDDASPAGKSQVKDEAAEGESDDEALRETQAVKISLEVQSGGEIQGKAQLAGEQAVVSGRHEGESLRIDLRGARLKGSLVAMKKEDNFVGSLLASVWREAGEPRYLALEGEVRLQAAKKEP